MIKLFVSCAFPVSNFTKHCIELGKALGLQLITLDRHEAGDIHEKIKNNMHKCQGVLFVLEEKNQTDGQRHNFSSWMSEERTIADGLNLPMCIINNSDFSIPDVFPNTLEHLDKSEINDLNVVAVLNSLKSKIEDVRNPPNAYKRNYLNHQVNIRKNGKVEYRTEVKIESLRNGLKDVRHSIYTQYSPCWDATIQGAEPQINIFCGNGNDLSVIDVDGNEKKYTWNFQFSRALTEHEEIKYGFIVEFPQFFPATKEILKNMSRLPNYPFIDDRIEHHFFVNSHTELLEMKLSFEDGSVAKNFNVTVYNGRIYSQDCVDNEETERIKHFLQVNETLFKEKEVKPELFTPVPDNRLNTGKPLIKMKNRLSPKR